MRRLLVALVFVAAWTPAPGSAQPNRPARAERPTNGVAASEAEHARRGCRSHYRRALADEHMALVDGDRDRALDARVRAADAFRSCAPPEAAPRELENEIAA
jgi:hypothetical protein